MWVRPAVLDPAILVPGITAFTGTAAIVLLGALADPGVERITPDERGLLPCPPTAINDLLSAHALQCWFDASNGRWRTLDRVSAHGALVVDIEATTVTDAEEIARRFVTDRGGGRFSEVLVYVYLQPVSKARASVRRIRWTAPTGFETMDFTTVPAP
jgi:hypothetical protein